MQPRSDIQRNIELAPSKWQSFHVQINFIIFRYTFIPSCHEAGPSKVIAGEPIFENPCSYEAVEKVLDHLLEEAEVGTTRHWTAVGCDGLPYVLASRIIEELYICPTCRIQYDEDEFINHIETSKHANDLEEGRKYRNILMLAGHGHFEINMTKALFKLLWDVCLLMELAKMLGFKSPKALAACQAAHDHHKSWQILEIFLFAMSGELLVPYVRQALEKETPSVEEFLASNKTPNEALMAKIVFDHSLALHVFRAGCPPAVNEFIRKNEAYTVTGHESKGEGGDFVLENLNRKSKGFMPPGLPTDEKWLTISRNIDKLDEIRLNMQTIMGLTEKDTEYTYAYDITEEITAFRQIIRESKYLQKQSLTTLSNKPLDSAFLHFSEHAQENKDSHYTHIQTHPLSSRLKHTPIFIFQEHREKHTNIANKTKAEISTHIETQLDTLNSHTLSQKWKKVKNLNFLKNSMKLRKLKARASQIAFFRNAVTPMHQACLQKEQSFTSQPTHSLLSDRDSPQIRQQDSSAESPPRVDSVVWVLTSLKVGDEADVGCAEEVEGEDGKVGDAGADEEAEGDAQDIEVSIVGTLCT
ncbi:uncharacterized protein LOC134251841 [Saccostrea cucullata]|uniref:uncharacterized protein LOC134251841 n=1 Tax=Saccostrea cuccullata TaxID=36930 RepID=UPI002ECFEE4B